jgi:hypothetical protein
MNAADLTARIRRLDRLSLGVARETQLVSEADIFLYRERREYLDALQRMASGLEAARVVLVKARHRLDGETGRRAGTVGIQEGRI